MTAKIQSFAIFLDSSNYPPKGIPSVRSSTFSPHAGNNLSSLSPDNPPPRLPIPVAMGGRRLKRFLRRKQPVPEPDDASRPSPPTHSGLLPCDESSVPGAALLRQFLATLGGRRGSPDLSRGLVRSATEWNYEFRQGRDLAGLAELRAQLNGRLARTGTKQQAGGWTRLMLGKDYTAVPARRQTHVLKFVMPYCACVACRVEAVKADMGMDDMDEMLMDAERGEGFGAVQLEGVKDDGEEDAVEIVRRRARFGRLPDRDALGLLGDTLESYEFELGTVSKIGGRGARVSFAPFAKQFFGGDEYCASLSMAQVADTVLEKAREYYKKNKGKTERRFYVHGTLNRFMLDGTSVALFPTPAKEPHGGVCPIGVLFRKQVMSIITGQLALEDSFGAFIHIDTPFYIGFGQDSEGAQTIFSDGNVGVARHLGINELRTHLEFSSGKQLEVNIR